MRNGKVTLLVGLDWWRAVVRQAVKVIAKLELRVNHLLPSNRLIGVGGSASHERSVVGINGSLGLVVGFIVSNAIDEVDPLLFPRRMGIGGGRPGDIVLGNILIFKHMDRSFVDVSRKLSGLFAAVHKSSELLMTF
jgi:hypothetical protein